ncbi:MAG: redoxin domain-containing protein [Acidimicrobiales bacterium]
MSNNIGEFAPDFTLPDHHGGTWSLSAQRGHDVIVIFHRHLM